jgi:hypothetical protein
MVKVRKTEVDPDASEWISALVSMKTGERKETLGVFCERCGIGYRHLYAVLKGDSSISQEVLDALKDRANTLGIKRDIEKRILALKLGIEQ